MRIVFFGTGDFAVPALKVCGAHVVLAVSQPGRASGRGMKIRPSPVEAAARDLGLAVATPEKARDPEFIASVERLAPDLLVVASYGQILRPRLLEAARIAPINLHGSILPRWRGAAPIQRAIEAGDRESGVTLMRMDAGMDTGPTIAFAPTPIGEDETAGSLSERLARLAAELLAEWLPRLGAGAFDPAPQPEEGATIARKVERTDARLDPTGPAAREYDRFRAFTPAPGAYIEGVRERLRILEARPVPEAHGEPGRAIIGGGRLILACAGGGLELRRVGPPGRPPMDGRAWANGARIASGDKLVQTV